MENKKDCIIGTWAEIPSPYVTHIMMKAGFDFSIIDMEHGIVDFETTQNMIFASHALNKQSFVRVPSIDEAWILRVLDMGCDGMIFPQVSSVEQIKRIIQYSCFAPSGKRGFNPYITAGGYNAVPDSYYSDENNRIKLGIILEGKDVFERLDEILQFKEIEILYIGQYDLSMALGIPGQVTHPLVLQYMSDAVERINIAGKYAGCMVHSIDEANKVITQGFNFIVYKVDTGILFSSIEQFVKGVNAR